MEQFIIFAAMVGVGFSIFILIRNHYVSKIRYFAIERTDFWAKKMFVDCEADEKKMGRWIEFFTVLESYPDHNQMIWDFGSNTFDDLYPDFEKNNQQVYDRIMLGIPSYKDLVNEFGGD
jgi:hypothetical protein